jgi:hypothetical protein
MEKKRIKASPVRWFIDYEFGYPEAFYAAQKESFPYSGTKLWVGNYRGRWVRWIDKKYCPDCVEAEGVWTREWNREWMERMKTIYRETEEAEQAGASDGDKAPNKVRASSAPPDGL